MSITSWTRLEPRCRDADMERTISARVYDPLWMLTRQWQVGEFQGEDAGTPVAARVRARTTLLSRCHLGALAVDTRTQAAAYDARAVPLETVVEQQRVRPQASGPGGIPPSAMRKLSLAVEAGLHFLRILDRQLTSKGYRGAFIARYALQLPDEDQLASLDAESVSFIETMAGRALDARRLEEAFGSVGPIGIASDPAVDIMPADRAEVAQAVTQWLDWYASLFSETAAASPAAWIPERLEYAVSVAGRLSDQPHDQKTLTADQFFDGHLDWYAFDVDDEVNLGTDGDRKFSALVQTTIPAPVTFRGAPAARFWEFEDARVAYGLVPVGPTDLAHLMMIEYASSYGNDWYVIPLDLEVGSLTSVQSLVVTDTFGVRTLQRPLGDSGSETRNWSMFQLSHSWRSGVARRASGGPDVEPNLFFLAPALGRSLEGPALEEVLFMRDEMANMAWAVERTIESPIEQSRKRAEGTEKGARVQASEAESSGMPLYRLSSYVPPHWIPLLPVQLHEGTKVLQRLKRGAVLQADGSQRVHRAEGDVLNAAAELLIEDQEVPREGVRVTRHYQLARWLDGSTFLWAAIRKDTGRGEASSGLRFDRIEAQEVPAADS